ncbi:hypothetical protein J4465_01290 [Candidatus Pacearchaeota archaeon]|nr:hypothetical protein [Candidatus Pacearchaeota archaeon]
MVKIQLKKQNKHKKLQLKPTLRERKHYLVFSSENISERDNREAISNAILNYIGLLGFAKAGLLFIEFKLSENKKNSYLMASINTKYVDVVKNSVLIFPDFEISCIGVSGTINKARRFYK